MDRLQVTQSLGYAGSGCCDALILSLFMMSERADTLISGPTLGGKIEACKGQAVRRKLWAGS